MAEQILVIDDDVLIQDALKDALEMEGYEVSLASNGLQALDLLLGGLAPVAVVLDHAMPVMNGYTFALEMKHHPEFSRVPLILLTGDAKARGMDAHTAILRKPVKLDALLDTIAQVKRRDGSARPPQPP